MQVLFTRTAKAMRPLYVALALTGTNLVLGQDATVDPGSNPRPVAETTSTPAAPVVDTGLATPSKPSSDLSLIVIDIEYQPQLIAADVPVTWKGASFILAEWDEATQDRVSRLSVPFRIVATKVTPDRRFYLFELDEDRPTTPAEWEGRVLYRLNNKVVIELTEEDAEAWMNRDYHAVRLPHRSIGWQPAASSLVAFDCAAKPLITTMLGRTNQAQWTDWIRKLSGVDQVTIGGTPYTIMTRNSATTFTGSTIAKGYDFLLEQMNSWHYPAGNIEQDPFLGTGGATWKNLILTIPGQTNPSDIVVMSAHFDTTSGNPTALAPGANDNGTGSATVFEAARLLRQFRFQRTIKLIWFTGEEQGTVGSEAYVADHSMAGYLGVVNLDMFGWDGNSDRCFEIHAGNLGASQDVGNCFSTNLTSYALGLSRDFLTSTATDRSDHASFWQVNVGAIEIAENFFTGGPTCASSDANPGYHTINDTLAGNMHPSFAFDVARGGLATIAAMAVPISSCFAGPTTVTLTPGPSRIDLSWTALPGASTYRIYRATQSCQGQWFEVGSTAGTTFSDLTATQNLAYNYYVEGVDADGFCTSPASACQSATPTITHAANTGKTVTDACLAGGPGAGNGVVE